MTLQQCDGDPDRISAVLAGLRAYRAAARDARRQDHPIVFQRGRVRLLDYGGEGRPVIFIPSLINPPFVLDLAPGNSLLEWLARRNVRPLLLDWGDPRTEGGDLSVSCHIERYVLPALEEIGPDCILAGYCLGGTMAIAAAACRPVAGMILMAAPWHFSGYPSDARQNILNLWKQAEPVAGSLGIFPMEMLQALFWRLDPERTVRKYAEFGALPPESPQAKNFVLLEDWANEGPPLALAAAKQLLGGFFHEDLTGSGSWSVEGRKIDPADLSLPVLNIRSSVDRIVPAAAAPKIGTDLLLDQGHVGMVVGKRAKTDLWPSIGGWLSDFRQAC